AHETLLIVEDDDSLREIVATLAKSLGYDVLETSGSTEAISTLERGTHVDLLLTDVVMPGVSGPELAARVRDRIAGGRVLFMSGYAEDTLRTELPHGAPLLRKPFSSEVLARKLRETLGDV